MIFSSEHYLSKKPTPELLGIAEFEATFFGYLSGLTVPTVGALLGMLVLSHTAGNWRIAASIGMYAFCVGIICVTIGYLVRNNWVVNGLPLSRWALFLDLCIAGPITALSYVVGVISLIALAYLGAPAVTAGRE